MINFKTSQVYRVADVDPVLRLWEMPEADPLDLQSGKPNLFLRYGAETLWLRADEAGGNTGYQVAYQASEELTQGQLEMA